MGEDRAEKLAADLRETEQRALEVGMTQAEVLLFHLDWKGWYDGFELLIDASAPMSDVRKRVLTELAQRMDRINSKAKSLLAHYAERTRSIQQDRAHRPDDWSGLIRARAKLPAGHPSHALIEEVQRGLNQSHDRTDDLLIEALAFQAEQTDELRNVDRIVARTLDGLVRRWWLYRGGYSVLVLLGAFSLLPLAVEAVTGWDPPLWQQAVLAGLLWSAQPIVDRHVWARRLYHGAIANAKKIVFVQATLLRHIDLGLTVESKERAIAHVREKAAREADDDPPPSAVAQSEG